MVAVNVDAIANKAVRAAIDKVLVSADTADEILGDALAEYVERRHGITGQAHPEWLREFLAERGYALLLIGEKGADA